MKLSLHIGCDPWSSARLQEVFDAKRGALIAKGVLFPRSPGRRNHTRLAMAVSDPDQIDALRLNRGFASADRQEDLRREVLSDLEKEIATHAPRHVILSAHQIGTNTMSATEVARLHQMLSPLADDIEVVIAVAEPSVALARHYAETVQEGRAAPLSRELTFAQTKDWWVQALTDRPQPDPATGHYAEVQAIPHWLDTTALFRHWARSFTTVRLVTFDEGRLSGPDATAELARIFDIPKCGRADPITQATPPSNLWLARSVAYNALLLKLLKSRDLLLPRQSWRRLLGDLEMPGDPVDPGALSPISRRFLPDLEILAKDHRGLTLAHLAAPEPCADWQTPDLQYGFRASQYLFADLGRVEYADKQARKARAADLKAMAEPATAPAKSTLPAAAQANLAKLQSSSFKPHNRLGLVNEEELAAAFPATPPRSLPKGSSGNVIVACMKNEAPYIVEWVAYHRAIGVDNFLIYTNGCEDSTSRLLDRMQALGLVEHRQNEDWKGKSPQQFALNKALKEKVVRKAEWLIHIDVDEFINVRCGNGTLDDFFARVPDATNVAMTWRLFGHNGITRFADRLVIDQFDACAPKFCPKPHTVWGFKTMFRNIGAYAKMSCHRPNKLDEAMADQVRWVNGSGRDITREAIKGGWRSSKSSIGYDLLQLNHYALRSAESFLVKRQRGRALHVDRSIGLNYWIRMDWSDYRDITIKRNIPRVRAEMDRMLADPALAALHKEGCDWHQAKADELRGIPEFADLFEQALKVRLTTTERVAYALSLDLES